MTGVRCSKGNFEHYTLKEIFEQPQLCAMPLLSRFLDDYGTAIFEELNFDVNELLICGTDFDFGLRHLMACGLCGVSYVEDHRPHSCASGDRF